MSNRKKKMMHCNITLHSLGEPNKEKKIIEVHE
jgi:hypothetical protein